MTDKPHCTCTPPDGVTRKHMNVCALFDVNAAYRQGRHEAFAFVRAEAEGQWQFVEREPQPTPINAKGETDA